MAFPTIPTVAGSRILFTLNTTGGATKTFPNLSSLTKNAGDLLIAICVEYDGNSTNAEFSSWGASFTEFADQAGTATMAIGAAYKWSTGSETGTFTVTTADTSTNDSVLILMSIPGTHATTPPEAGSMQTSTAEPPAAFGLNPTGWGAEDTLWIAVGGSGETSTTGSYTGIASAPANYTDYADSGITADVVGGVEAAVAFRQLNNVTETPGAWTGDTSNARGAALVIAVRPAQEAIKDEIAISSFTGGGTSEKVGGGATYEKDEIAISAFVSAAVDEHIATEAGAAASAFSGSGESVVEYVETGTGTTALTAAGVAVREFPKAGSATSARVSSGADVVESAEAGTTIAERFGSGVDVAESVETGVAVSARLVLGDGEQSQANDGKGVSEFSASGAAEWTLNRSGSAESARVASGVASLDHLKSGAGISPFSSTGTSTMDLSRAGMAISPFTGGGTSQTGGDIVKVGTATSLFTGTGDATWQVERSGSVVSTHTGGGASSSERPRIGVAILIATVAGQSAREISRSGTAALAAIGSGGDAVESIESGTAILVLAGSGNKEGASVSKTGTAIMAHSAEGFMINYIVIGGPTADVILAVKARASVRKVSPL